MNLLSRSLSTLRDRLIKRRRKAPPICLRVSNLTRHTVLATCMEVADSGLKRNKGLLGRKRLAPGEGLWILPCEAVQKLRSAVPPWRLSACLSAHSVLELVPGTIRETQTSLGDTLEFSSPLPPGDNFPSA